MNHIYQAVLELTSSDVLQALWICLMGSVTFFLCISLSFVLAADLQIKHRAGIWIIRWRGRVKNRCCCTVPQRHGERNEKPNYWFQSDPWKLQMWDNSWFQRIRGCASWLQDKGLVLHISFILCPQFSNSIFTFRPHSFFPPVITKNHIRVFKLFFCCNGKSNVLIVLYK